MYRQLLATLPAKPATPTRKALSKRRSWLTAAQVRACLPAELRDSDQLVSLLTATRIPNKPLVPLAARLVARIVRNNPWFLSAATRNTSYETLDALTKASRLAGDSSETVANASDAEHFSTLVSGRSVLPQLERVRAIYLLARLEQASDRSVDTPSDTAIGLLGGTIRRIENKGSKLFGAAQLASVESATRLLEIGELAAVDLESHDSELAEDWPRYWLPWIRRRSAEASAHQSNELDPPETPSLAVSWSTPGDDLGGAPGIDLPPVRRPMQSPKHRVPPSSKFSAAFADQVSRSRNLELSKDHIEVATDEEMKLVVNCVQRMLDRNELEAGLDRAPCLLLLTAATGRLFPALADAEVNPNSMYEGRRRLVIDLKRGRLISPVLTPNHIRIPADDHLELFDPNTGFVELGLPPLVVTLLRRLYAWRKVTRVIEWIDDIDPEQQIHQFLRTVPGLPTSSARSSAPYRRWLGCALQETFGDLVTTMLVTGDTFGRSVAPLYYSSPTSASLLDRHRIALSVVFTMPEAATEGVTEPSRVGPAHVARLQLAVSGVSQISKRLNVNSEKALGDCDKAIRYHQSLTDYLGHYIAIITTNRPNRSLYRLTRNQFDLEHHVAILQDKKADAEHFTRLVATTPSLSSSILLYLSHLRSLCARWGTLESQLTVEKIASGEAPLLQYLQADGKLRQGTLEDFSRGTAKAWCDLPPNWYRPLLCTYLREHGSQPLAVYAQAGHLEAASHPFSADSPLSPIEVVGSVRPALLQFEKELGFRVIGGFAGGAPQVDAPKLLTWGEELREHEVHYRAIVRDQLVFIRSHLKENRQAAAHWLTSNVKDINPTLHRVFLAVRSERAKARPKKVDPELRGIEVADSDIELLLSRNDEEHLGRDALRVAVHNLLCRWLRAAGKAAGTIVMDIGLINLSPRSELSPLLIKNCVATEQIGLLRKWLEARVALAPALPPQVLRTLSLVLFEGLRDQDEIVSLCRIRDVPPTLWGQGSVLCASIPGRRGPVTLTGLPALALGACIPEHNDMRSADELGRLLSSHLPSHLIPSEPDRVLEYLATTAQIASRVERPGVFRYAASPQGVLEAPIAHQAAFLAASFPVVGPAAQSISDENQETLEIGDSMATSAPEPGPRLSGVSKALLHRYDRLLLALTDPETVLSRFKVAAPINASSKQSGLIASVQALDVCEPDRGGQAPLDIASALAGFARDLCIHGTRMRVNPAASTVYQYVSTIGRDLLDVFESSDLRALFEDDFEAAYELFNHASSREKSGGRASMVLADFHKFLVEHYGLPPVVVPRLDTSGAGSDLRPDAVLLTEAQYLAARDRLLSAVDMSASHSFSESSWRRVAYASCVALILLRRAGTRISECVLMRRVDLKVIRDSVFLVVRPSIFRQLKTAAAKRRIDITDSLHDEERRFIMQWLQSEARVHSDRERKTLLFPCFGIANRPLGATLLRKVIQDAFGSAAGIEMNPHQLRHLWLTEQIGRAAESTRGSSDLNRRMRRFERVRLEVGHTRLRTGMANYVHTRVQICRLDQERGGGAVTRWMLSALSRLSVSNVDKLRNRHCSDDPSRIPTQWIDIVFSRVDKIHSAPVAAAPSALRPGRKKQHEPLPISALDRLVRLFREGADVEELCASFGISRTFAVYVRQCALDLSGPPTFYRLLPSLTKKRTVVQEPLPRDVDGGAVEGILGRAHMVKRGLAGALLRQTYSPSSAKHDSFCGSRDQLAELRQLLLDVGVRADAMLDTAAGLKVTPSRDPAIRFHSVVWALSILSLHESITSRFG